ncbi:hypothetical protein G2W53_015826 [Senna tora]|uniref:Uncharacterized protein n=1 Tax=Senna tora TaxID=362788 RepID=A0A834WWA5_9FABA|nr:hypothetical protein G2W53_015826 [Senna tora]
MRTFSPFLISPFLLVFHVPKLVFSNLFSNISENSTHMGIVELEELEVIEVDEALLRELLEEEHGGGGGSGSDIGGGDVVETVENGNRIMDNDEHEQQKQKLKFNCSERHEGCNNNNNNIVHHHEFEWVSNMNMMMELEPISQINDGILNWYYQDYDMVGMMVDFGYTNVGECGSQIYEGFVSNNEASYGCLWEDL